MTNEFDKFMEYSYLDDSGHRRLNKDAPEEIKEEARKADKSYFERTGRHKMLVDY